MIQKGPGCYKPRISENFNFSFAFFRWGFLFILFVLQFWAWAISNNIKDKKWKTFLTRKINKKKVLIVPTRKLCQIFPANTPKPRKPGYKYPGSDDRVIHSDAPSCFVPCNFVFIFNLFLFHVSLTVSNSFFIYEKFWYGG